MLDIDALLVPPLILAVIFFVSAYGHFRLQWQVRVAAMERLGLPRWARTRLAATVHPALEGVLAVGLLATRGPLLTVVATTVLVLVLVYLAIVVRALVALEVNSCGCFGALKEGELTWRTVLRNVLLVALAAAALIDATKGLGVLVRFAAAPWSAVAAATVVAGASGLVWLVLEDLRLAEVSELQGTVDLQRKGLRALESSAGVTDLWMGQESDGGSDSALDRRPVHEGLLFFDVDNVGHDVALLAARMPQLVIFGSTTCASCIEIREQLPRFVAMLPGIEVRYVLPAHSRGARPDLGPGPVFYMRGRALAEGLGAPATVPAAVLVGADGLTAGDASGSRAIAGMVAGLAVQLLEMQAEAGSAHE